MKIDKRNTPLRFKSLKFKPLTKALILACVQFSALEAIPSMAQDGTDDTIAQGTTATGTAGQGTTGQDTTGQDTTGQGTTGQGTTGQGTTGQDTTGQDTTGQDTTGQDTTGQGTTGQDTTGQGTTGQGTTGQGTTGQGTTGQGTTGQGTTGQGTTGQGTTGQGTTGQGTTGQGTTGQGTTGQGTTGQGIVGQNAVGQNIAQPQNRLNRYRVTSLVTNQSDARLVNPWGLAFNHDSPAWIANNGSGTASLYDGNGTPFTGLPFVTIPQSAGNPTGIVANHTEDFDLPATGTDGNQDNNPARFIFATENGRLAGWSQQLADLNNAIVLENAVPPSGETPVYKGLALASNGEGHFLYATDFHNARIQVFDKDFNWVDPQTAFGCNFTDARIPTGFAPFGIQNIHGALYVTYARQDQNQQDDVPGRGSGFVDVFDANGCLIRRFASRGRLNSPWGIAMAPANFGIHSNTVLIANFGDGSINAFDPITGRFRGALLNVGDTGTRAGRRILLDGIWGIAFGNGVLNQPTNTLFFTSGPNDEANGVYGKIEAVRRNQNNTGQTGTGQTGTGQTGTGQTGTGQTGTGQTGTGQTGTGQTGTGQTGTGQTGTGQTGTGQTGAGQTGAGQTGTDQTGTGQTGTNQTGTGQTGTDQTGTGQTGTGQTGTDQTGTGQTGTGQTGTGQTGTGQTGTDQTGTGQTGTGQTGTGQTGTGQTGTGQTGTGQTGTGQTDAGGGTSGTVPAGSGGVGGPAS
jgi:uncharacterized protein (TIGR03118 family)